MSSEKQLFAINYHQRENPFANVYNVVRDTLLGKEPTALEQAEAFERGERFEQIVRVMHKVAEGHHKITHLGSKEAPAILLMGNTGSGKSTLAHVLSNRKLKAVMNDGPGTFVLEAVTPDQNLTISPDPRSETKVPNKCFLHVAERIQPTVWDCPGFRDTDPEQMIANSFYIKSLYNMHRNLKFVLVVPESALYDDRGNSFLKTVSEFCNHFTDDIGRIRNSVMLAITKVQPQKKAGHITYTLADIMKHRDDAKLDYAKLHPNTKLMVEFLQEQDPILFYAPNREGELDNASEIIAMPRTVHAKGQYTNSSDDLGKFSLPAQSLNLTQDLFNQSFCYLRWVFKTLQEATLNPLRANIEDGVLDSLYNKLESILPDVVNYTREQPIDHEGAPSFRHIQQQIKLCRKSQSDFDALKATGEGALILEGMADFAENLFNVYEEYAASPHLREKIKHFAYFTNQMKTYCSTFAGVLDAQDITTDGKTIHFVADIKIKEFSKILGIEHSINTVKKHISDGLKGMITNLDLSENMDDISYYLEAIQILKHYSDIDEGCKEKVALCYKILGDINKEAGENQNLDIAVKCYLLSLNFDKTIIGAYESLGDIYEYRNQYKAAIKFYEVIEHYDKLKSCYKTLFDTYRHDPHLRAEYADILREMGHFNKAKIYYRRALNLSKDLQIQKSLKQKMVECSRKSSFSSDAQQMEEKLEQSIIFDFDKLDIGSFVATLDPEMQDFSISNVEKEVLNFLGEGIFLEDGNISESSESTIALDVDSLDDDVSSIRSAPPTYSEVDMLLPLQNSVDAPPQNIFGEEENLGENANGETDCPDVESIALGDVALMSQHGEDHLA